MTATRFPRRAARGALMGAATTALLLFSQSPSWAVDGRRIAFSQKMGVEVFAAGGADWCREDITLQVLATDKDLFERPEFTTLMKRVGSMVLGKECPAARKASIAGVDKTTGAIAWQGRFDADTAWTVHPLAQAATTTPVPVATVAGSAVPAPTPTPVATGGDAAASDPRATAPATPPAEQPLPVASGPLAGEWTGNYVCGNSRYPMTISVFKAQNNHFSAVVEMRDAQTPARFTPNRYYADGFFDTVSRQVQVKPKTWIRRSDLGSVEFNGTLDPEKRALNIEPTNCYSKDKAITLSRTADTPEVAHRVISDERLRERWVKEELLRPRQGRIVGVLPRGTFRMPSCEELIAWSNSFPADQRVRLFADNDRGMLRHFDDATTQRVFGSPAYYWLRPRYTNPPPGSDKVNFVEAAQHACGYKGYGRVDAKMEQLLTVIRDDASAQQITERFRYDQELAALAPTLATRGDTAEDGFAALAVFATAEGIERNLRLLNPNSLTPEDKANLLHDVLRYQGILADRAGADAERRIADTPATVGGLGQVDGEIRAFTSRFSKEAVSKVTEAANARKHAIARELAKTAIAEIGTMPRTLDGMVDADLRISELKDAIGPLDPDALRDLEGAGSRYLQDARDAVVKSEIDAISAVPATLDGAKSLTKRRADLTRILGKDAPLSFAAYGKAVDVRIAEIGAAALPDFRTQLAALPTAWTSIGDAYALTRDRAAAVAGTPAEAAFTKAADERVETILSALADQAVLDVKGLKQEGLRGASVVMVEAEKAAKPFAANPLGKPSADRVLAAGRARGEEILAAFLPEFRTGVEMAPPSRAMAVKLSAASIALDRMSKTLPAYGKLRDVARTAAERMHIGICDKAMEDASLSSSDGRREVLVGNDVTTLRQFVCDLRESGIRATGFETPGFFSSSKDFVLKFYAPDNLGERIVAGALVNGLSLFLGGGRPDTSADLFDFTPVKRGGSAKNAIETPGQIVFRDLEIRQNKTALVGVSIGDVAKSQALSLHEWRETSKVLAVMAHQGPTDTEKLCESWKTAPDKLGIYDAGQALLTCPRKS